MYDSLEKLDGKGDVIIDFSSPAAVEKALPYCEAHKPVSYTHLDVYKRQVFYNVRRSIIEGLVLAGIFLVQIDRHCFSS